MKFKKIAVMALCLLLAVSGKAGAANLKSKANNSVALTQPGNSLQFQQYVEGSFGFNTFKPKDSSNDIKEFVSKESKDIGYMKHVYVPSDSKVNYCLDFNVGYGVSLKTASPVLHREAMPILDDFLRGGSIGVRASWVHANTQMKGHFDGYYYTKEGKTDGKVKYTVASEMDICNIYTFMATGSLDVFDTGRYSFNFIAGLGLAFNQFKDNDFVKAKEEHDEICFNPQDTECNFAYMIGVREETKLNKKVALTLEIAYQHLGSTHNFKDNALRSISVDGILGGNLGIKYYI